MPHLEQAVIDSFNQYFKQEAVKQNKQIRSFSLGGQDALVGADYILTDQSQFALIEYKYTQHEITSESKKPHRHALCKKLESNVSKRKLHDKCHFIAWSEEPEMRGRCNVYRLEVCNQKVFGASCGLSTQNPQSNSRIGAKQFIGEFFANSPPRSLGLQEFEKYLAWLLNVAGTSTSKSLLQLLTLDDSSDECAMVPFASISEAYDWMQKRPRAT